MILAYYITNKFMQYAEKVIDGFAVCLSLAVTVILFYSKTFPATIFFGMYAVEGAENPNYSVFGATWFCVLLCMSPFFYLVKRSLRY